ncbi:hypothetical protein An15g07640 [Aspergillus niger]|uniref:Uncharacterized protein n=2 Tax=Aspergillus niger TaxID=5061 RepID=A2R6E3_ASPNC|nr:hypothetical protein An15g07640 [Aspergillus niger]CAK42651.1 hypothetical protein An15g07640 [Aspergillus niger]
MAKSALTMDTYCFLYRAKMDLDGLSHGPKKNVVRYYEDGAKSTSGGRKFKEVVALSCDTLRSYAVDSYYIQSVTAKAIENVLSGSLCLLSGGCPGAFVDRGHTKSARPRAQWGSGIPAPVLSVFLLNLAVLNPTRQSRFSETRKSTPDVDTYSIEEDYCTKENQGHIYLDVHTRIAQAKLEIIDCCNDMTTCQQPQDNASAQTDIEQDVSQDDICALRKGHIP